MASRIPTAAAALAAATLAAGCSLAPRYQRPAAPVAASFPSAAAPGAGATPAADLGWRDVLPDARLQALVELALTQNRDLRVAALNAEAVRAQYRIQRAALLPAVAGVATASRTHTPADLSLSGKESTSGAWQVGAAASFELDLFGRLRSLSDAALEQYLATEEARRATHLALVSAVASQELAGRAAEEQVALARATLDTVAASAEITRASAAAGRATELDLRTAESQVETARVNLAAAEQVRARAASALALLVGGPLPEGLPPPAPLDAGAPVAELPAGVPSEVLVRRPDVLAAEHALQSANAAVGAARAAFFPSISLTGQGGTASASLDGLFAGGSLAWTFSPRISLPIFAGGALQASLDAAELRKQAEVARYERAVQGAFREVADALEGRAFLDRQLQAQSARVAAEARRTELADLRYRGGVDSYLTVLTAQRDLFAARQGLIQVRLARLVNLVDLYRSLGGGWRERTEKVASR